MKVTVIKKQLLLVAALLVAAEAPAYGMADAWNRMSSVASRFLSSLTIKNVSLGLVTAATATAALRPLFSYCKARLELLKERFVSPARNENPILSNEETVSPHQPMADQTSESRLIWEFSTDELTLLMRRVRQDITLLGDREAGYLQKIFINCYQVYQEFDYLGRPKFDEIVRKIGNFRMRKIFEENREEHVNALREIASYITQENIARMHPAVLKNIVCALDKMNCATELKTIYNLIISIDNAPEWLYKMISYARNENPILPNEERTLPQSMASQTSESQPIRKFSTLKLDLLMKQARHDVTSLGDRNAKDIQTIFINCYQEAQKKFRLDPKSVAEKKSRWYPRSVVESRAMIENPSIALYLKSSRSESERRDKSIQDKNLRMRKIFEENREEHVNALREIASYITQENIARMHPAVLKNIVCALHEMKCTTELKTIYSLRAYCVTQDNIAELADHGELYGIVNRLIEIKSVEGLKHIASCVTPENFERVQQRVPALLDICPGLADRIAQFKERNKHSQQDGKIPARL